MLGIERALSAKQPNLIKGKLIDVFHPDVTSFNWAVLGGIGTEVNLFTFCHKNQVQITQLTIKSKELSNQNLKQSIKSIQ